ncbi:hypothetical protein niasHT_014707 [Heterodera trifolii]|uniref:Integrase catalytic domain-containing protein n=1 Tax=Heterodera trifolii TaxID=157864 RepID=A0ABD2KWQ7_9BILA
MDSEIERVVRQSDECQSAQKSPIKAQLAPWTVTEKAFQRVHIDFAGPCQDGFVYFILVDAFSKWPEVYQMSSITAKSTVFTIRSIIQRLGIPEEIVSDNGTQFKSAEFAAFCQEFGIKHTFSPPFHPQSNGQVERFVDIFKRAMKKTTLNNAIDGYSPDQLFFGRKLRTKLALVLPKGHRNDSENIDKIHLDKEERTIRIKWQNNSMNGMEPKNILAPRYNCRASQELAYIPSPCTGSWSNCPPAFEPTRRNCVFEENSKHNPGPNQQPILTVNGQAQNLAHQIADPVDQRTDQQAANEPPTLALRRSQRKPKPVIRFSPSGR